MNATGTQAARRFPTAALLRSCSRELLLIIAFSLVTNLLMLVPTLYLLQVFDRVLVSHSELTLLAVSLIALLLLGVMAVCDWARTRVLAHAAMRLEERLSERAFRAGLARHLEGAGAEASGTWSDVQQLRQFLAGPGVFTLCDLPWVPVYAGVAYLLHPFLGFVAVLFILVQAAIAWFGHRRTVAPAEDASRAGRGVQAFLHGKLRHAETVEALGMLPTLRRRWRDQQDAALTRAADAQRISNRVQTWSKFLRYTQQSLALAAGALLVIDGQLSPSAMIAANLLIMRALVPMDQLVTSWRSLLATRDALARLAPLLAEDGGEHAQAGTHATLQGNVTLQEVTAHAPGREHPVLRQINFECEPGRLIAVLGPSGAGKSTLARVLVGAWPQVDGTVLLDGVPLDRWDRTDLGRQVGYLPQDIELLEGSIADNIARLGKVDSIAVIEAASAAGLHDAILRSPQGYNTPVGEAGRLLSGGQRQRLGLARALYGKPRLVVLDEPDANLDEKGQAALQRALRDLRSHGATVFIVTHQRSGLVPLADHVLVLHEGQLRVQGPPEAVLAILRAATPIVLPPSLTTAQPT
jgi:ATP-binding cassette, subfamily C, bacterial exporter for protease/lipase